MSTLPLRGQGVQGYSTIFRMPLYALPFGYIMQVNYSRDAKIDRLEMILLKKKILACVVLLICFCLAVNGTLAYYTGWRTSNNVITTGSIKIELVEMAENDKRELVPFENVSGIVAGDKVSKIVYVINTGANDAWVRIKMDTAVKLEGEGEAKKDVMTLDLNTTDWTEKDGYYYYNSALKPTESTKPLFTKVSFSTEMGNEFQGSSFSIDLQAQATQVDNNGTTVLEAAGWPNPELPVA